MLYSGVCIGPCSSTWGDLQASYAFVAYSRFWINLYVFQEMEIGIVDPTILAIPMSFQEDLLGYVDYNPTDMDSDSQKGVWPCCLQTICTFGIQEIVPRKSGHHTQLCYMEDNRPMS
ncbi:unnamed protein product [Owenia fusiformis]|uniref:Uncharacterized protein n=1 Tax=Owenia fusiformis TaxID=6347 RepID=A0A8S4NBL5_OWEFU|nr:unnamed protein product [Owenia fusiformis]